MDTLLRELTDNPLLRRAITAALVVLVIVVIVRLANRWLSRLIGDADARYRSRKAVTLIGSAAAVLAVVAILSDNLPAVGLTIGVIGAAIAFSVQEVFISIAGWVSIASGGLYRVGDRVQVAGIKGDVIDIGVLRTTLMEVGEWVKGDLYNGRIVRIANAAVFKQPVFNYSGDFPFLWDEIQVPIHHGSDQALARRVIADVAAQVAGDYVSEARETWDGLLRRYRMEAAAVEPTVSMVFDENWMTFTLRYVVDYRRRRSVKDRLSTGILGRIAESDGRIALAVTGIEIWHPDGIALRRGKE